MPNIVKLKFAGLLRGLLQRFDDNGSTVVAPSRPLAAATSQRGSSPAAAPTSKPLSRPQPVFATPPAATATGPNGLQLPLPSIIAGLPMDLRAKLAQTPPADAMVSVPVDKVLSQLAHGSVRISFGELRAARPGLFVSSGTENDVRQIVLPLNEIISRISPALLSRRVVKKIEVADDIAGPFGARMTDVKITSAPPPAKPAPMPPPKATETLVAPAGGKSVTPVPAMVSKARVTAPRPAPVNAVPAATVAAALPDVFKPVASKTAPTPAPQPSETPIPIATVSSPPTAAPAAEAFNSAPQIPLEDPILVPLSALAEKWPDAIKQELAQARLAGAQAALPPSLIEPGLKRGRVSIQWKHLRGMIRPTPAPVSSLDSAEIELPLKVLAPLFFSSQKAAGLAKQKVSVAEDIPDLFLGSAAPAPAAVVMPRATTPAPAHAPMSVPASAAPHLPAPVPAPGPVTQAKAADTNYYSQFEPLTDTEFRRQEAPGTDFMSRGATPGEIVSRAIALPGVVGAVVALYDGLMVASQLPPELNADTVAAFLPQIFARTSQSTKELRMGELNNLSFTVGNVPWKIYRVNAVYFAAFGHAGEALPKAPLAELARLLDRRK